MYSCIIHVIVSKALHKDILLTLKKLTKVVPE